MNDLEYFPHNAKWPERLPLTGSESTPKQINCRCVMTEVRQQWDGKGLPPVGSRVVFHADDYDDCDFRRQLKNGMEVEIITHYRTSAPLDVAVFKFNVHYGFDLVEQATAACFRPIQTEEEKAISEIETMINKWLRKEDGAEKLAKKIYKRWVKNQDTAE